MTENVRRWVDPISGYRCKACLVEELGHWCGYAEVPPGHPLHGVDRNARMKPPPGWLDRARPLQALSVMDLLLVHDGSVPLGLLLEVHGGVTFAGAHHDDTGWWFGFDCAHAGDLVPGLPRIPGAPQCVYRDIDYVTMECQHLAEQLHQLATVALANIKT